MNTALKPLSMALMSALPVPSGADVPEWIHLLPATQGRIETRDQRGPYLLEDAQAMIAASFAEDDALLIDVNHATDVAAPRGSDAPAVGWIKAMEARADGIWGRVEWNSSGERMLREREYRGVSPVILHDAEKRIFAITRASLVNKPNLRGLSALNAEELRMTLLQRMAELLGLDAQTASDDQILSAVTTMKGKGEEPAAALQSALGVADGGDLLEAAQAVAATAALVPALQAEVSTLKGALDTLQSDSAKTAATAFIDGEIRKGRTIASSMREHYIARHMREPEIVEREIAAIPLVGPAKTTHPNPAANPALGQSLNAVDLAGRARVYQDKLTEAGQSITFTQAVKAVQEGKA